jgi:hypothetical protein
MKERKKKKTYDCHATKRTSWEMQAYRQTARAHIRPKKDHDQHSHPKTNTEYLQDRRQLQTTSSNHNIVHEYRRKLFLQFGKAPVSYIFCRRKKKNLEKKKNNILVMGASISNTLGSLLNSVLASSKRRVKSS